MTAREFEKILKKNGWIYNHQSGDHRIWYKKGRHISFPIKKFNPMFVRRLIKEYRLEV